MAFKIVLIIAALAQFVAAILALRLNLRYRIYSAWVLISAAAFVMAVLRVTTLLEIWEESTTVQDNFSLWTTSLTSLTVSLFFVAGLAMIEPFFQEIARAQETLRRQNEKLKTDLQETEAELRLARQIQSDLLPTSPPDFSGLDVAACCEPAEWTSGDYYDYVPLANGEIAFVVADACGHGLGPALSMSSARASIRALAKTVDDVGKLLTQANPAVYDANSARFVTAFASKIDPLSRELTYAGAGQPAFLLKADGSRRMLAADAPPLGALPDISVPTRRLPTLELGDILTLVTDGILETSGANAEMFGEDRLFEVVAEHREKDSAAIIAKLFDAVHRFANGNAQADDNTAVVIKVVG